MNIGSYIFEEFKQKIAETHGFPAPGVLIGGYMTEMAKRALPDDAVIEAVVETRKCVPDAVKLLTGCEEESGGLKVIDTGEFALSLFDRRSGEGWRVSVDTEKLASFPEIEAWLLKEKPKKDQDIDRLFSEIERAGDFICAISKAALTDLRTTG